MPEILRSVKVRVEVDTNKDTYVLDEEVDTPQEAGEMVDRFISNIFGRL